MEVLSDKTVGVRRIESDERAASGVVGMAQRRLKESAYLDLRFVSCQFRDGVVTLSGHVPTYYLKQVAQTVVGQLEQIDQVVNNLDVSGDLSPSPRSFRRRV